MAAELPSLPPDPLGKSLVSPQMSATMASTERGRSYDLLVAWFVALLFSLGVGLSIYLSGKWGDCTPHERDGQCGISTFIGLIYGVFAGTVLLVTTTACVLFVVIRRRSARRESIEGNSDAR